MNEKHRQYAVSPMMDWTDVSKKVANSIAKGSDIGEVVPSLYFLALVSPIPMELRGRVGE